MRRSVIVVLLALLATLGAYGPVAAATPTSNAKVVIIVGADTPQYLDDADQLYKEAIQHTTNVVRVYSPKATWAAVKSATTNANVVIYLGHGNGWPSPYTFDPYYTTKDGFGLNATAGTTHGNLKYYGEPSIRTLDLAPNAVVFLFHLCYASGNNESWDTSSVSWSKAQQRAANYASAFLAAGASVVIADGHSHNPYYLRELFTKTESLELLWRKAPSFNNHVRKFVPTHTTTNVVLKGTGMLDPENSSSGFYRSIVGEVSVSTSAVIGELPTGSITASRDDTTTVTIQAATTDRSSVRVITRR